VLTPRAEWQAPTAWIGSDRLVNAPPVNQPERYGLAVTNPQGGFDVGGSIGLSDINRAARVDPLLSGAANLAAEVAPISGNIRAGERVPELYNEMVNAQNPIQQVLRGAEMGLEGVGTVAELLPYVKAGLLSMGALTAMMSRRSKQIGGMADNAIAAFQRGIIGYHGSPHKYSKFDHSMMGSGEGAQAYGWGTYIAENPDVAKQYQHAGWVPDKAVEMPDGSVLVGAQRSASNATPQTYALEALTRFDGDKVEALKFLSDGGPMDDGAIDWINANIKGSTAKIVDNPNNLYEVDLPDEKIAQMLDWDAPLSEMPEDVQAPIRKLLDNRSGYAPQIPNEELEQIIKNDPLGLLDITDDFDPYGHMKGRDIYTSLAEELGGQQQASEAINQLGIPGIKYWDGGSRSAGEGTRNFVVFDENDLTILKRNNEVLKQADSLPMDEASRMARAKEMGFDTDVKVHHGGLGAKRIKEFDRGYGGQTTGNNEHGAFHFVDVDEIADDYGRQSFIRRYQDNAESLVDDGYIDQKTLDKWIENDSVYDEVEQLAEDNIERIDAYLRLENPYVLDMKGGRINVGEVEELSAALQAVNDGDFSKVPEGMWDDLYDMSYYEKSDISDYWDEITEKVKEDFGAASIDDADDWMIDTATDEVLSENGIERVYPSFDGIIIKDMVDDIGDMSNQVGNQYIVFDPEKIRRTDATFDKARRNSANILAGGAAAAIGANALIEDSSR
jgi:hypothetical protein